MRIGVVMPTFNQAQWLPGALASVESQVTDAFIEPYLAVVDDGSTDATPQVIQWFSARGTRVHHVRQPNQGTAAAINQGVAQFSGDPLWGGDDTDALTWVSSDNVMTCDWLQALGEKIATGAGVAYGGFYYVTPERCSYMFTPYDPERLIADVNCFFGPAFLIRADVWREAGPHRGRISHDYDHWLRVEEVCWRRGLPIVGVDTPLCWYNAHDKRVTVTRAHEFDAPHWQAEARKRRGLV